VALTLLSLAAAAAWIVSLIRTLQLANTLKGHPALNSAMQDERVRYARLRAFALGFWVALISQALILGAASFGWSLPSVVAARLTLAFGVLAVSLAFVVYERE
jgi:hypothetical protein